MTNEELEKKIDDQTAYMKRQVVKMQQDDRAFQETRAGLKKDREKMKAELMGFCQPHKN